MSSATPSDRGRVEERLARGGAAVELLRAPAWLFGAVARARGALYDAGALPHHRLAVPVVCVGNLTAGGTGKSPAVRRIARWFTGRGWRPGVLSRGYRAAAGGGAGGAGGDEARDLARALPGVLAVQDPDRVRGGRELARRGADVVLLDDGFQHRRLHRDRDLVLVDCTRPFGLPWDERGRAPRHFLPRGLLREPPAALARADALLLTRADQVAPERLAALEAELEALAPGVPRVPCAHRPTALLAMDGDRHALAELDGRDVDLVSGVGNPAAFEHTVAELGARVREHRAFPDHHAYAAADVAGLGAGGAPVVTTTKDAVKLDALLPGALAVEVELEPDASRDAALWALLEALPHGRPARERAALHEGLHG